MTVVEQLAACVSRTAAVPEAAQEAARRCIADLMTSVVAGCATLGGRSARAAAPAIFGAGPAPLWFGDRRLTVAGAAFANAAVACMLDLDDGHRAAAGHPGAAIIPAVLAEAAQNPAHPPGPLPRLLTAIAIGYEIGIRLSRARDFATLDNTATGRWCGVGVAAAIGWLRGLPGPILAQALGIAAGHAPHMLHVGVRNEAGHVKEAIPWAVAGGIAAVDLAMAGHTGGLSSHDADRTLDHASITRDWGAAWLIEGTYFKPYSCCRWAHAPLDALAALLAEEPVAPEAIEAIEVDTFSRILQLGNQPDPASMEAAQYSVPYVLGLFALHGKGVLLPMRPECLGDAGATALARRVTLRVDARLDAMFPAAAPGRVTLVAHGRRRMREVLLPWGEPGNPMRWADLRAKQRAIGADPALWQAIETMRAGDIAPLLTLLARPQDSHFHAPGIV